MALLAPVSGRQLSVDRVDDLVRLARLGIDDREVAARVSCTLSTVYALLGPAILGRKDSRSPLRLSLADREEIRAGVERGDSLPAIARLLNRNVSTISRGIRRNGGRDAYRAWRADERAVQASRRARAVKIETNTELRAVVEAKLRKRWSPQQIAQHLRRTYPHD